MCSGVDHREGLPSGDGGAKKREGGWIEQVLDGKAREGPEGVGGSELRLGRGRFSGR